MSSQGSADSRYRGCCSQALPPPAPKHSRGGICTEQSILSKNICSPMQDMQGGSGGHSGPADLGAPPGSPTATGPGRGSPPWVPVSGVDLAGLLQGGSHCLISHRKAATLNVGHAQTRPAEEGGDTEVGLGEGTQRRAQEREAWSGAVQSPGSSQHLVATKAQRGRHLQQGHSGAWGQRGVKDTSVLAPRHTEGS